MMNLRFLSPVPSLIGDWFRLPGSTPSWQHPSFWHSEPDVYFKCHLNKKNVRICSASCRTQVIPTAAKVDEGLHEATPQPTATTISDPWAGFSCDRLTCQQTTPNPTLTPPIITTTPLWHGWSCDRDSRFTCAPSTTPIVSTTTLTDQTILPITVVEYPHLIYEVETKASDYVIMGRKKFRIRCKCPRSDPDRACNWYQSDIKFTEEFLNSLRCDPPGVLPPMTTTTPRPTGDTTFQGPTTPDVPPAVTLDVTVPASDPTST